MPINQQVDKETSIYVCIYVIEYYSAIKKNELMAFAAIWMGSEMVILSEVTRNGKPNMFSLISGS